MGLKCSLFGHAFDERDVVRERDSTGSEVVTVVKDIERCTQCGSTRIVSTNKEVVSAAGATADGGVNAGATLRTPGADATGGTDTTPGADATGGTDTADAFESPDQFGDGGDGPGPAAGAATPDADGDGGARAGGTSDGFDDTGFETPDDPATDGTVDTADDDATILSGGDDAGDASPDGTTVLGDAADGAVEATEPADPGDEDAEPVTEDAEPVTEDAEILTDDEPTDRAPGRWPGEDTPDAWEPGPLGEDEPPNGTEDATDDGVEAADDDSETPETAAEPAPDVEPTAEASFTVPDGHYRCGECGHTIPASSSFRRGDACPECVHGYLESGE